MRLTGGHAFILCARRKSRQSSRIRLQSAPCVLRMRMCCFASAPIIIPTSSLYSRRALPLNTAGACADRAAFNRAFEGKKQGGLPLQADTMTQEAQIVCSKPWKNRQKTRFSAYFAHSPAFYWKPCAPAAYSCGKPGKPSIMKRKRLFPSQNF